MVLRIPETGLHLESLDRSADTLPLQAFAFTLSDNVIEDLIRCVQNGEDVKLSLGPVPVSVLLCLFAGTVQSLNRRNDGWPLLLVGNQYNRRLHSRLQIGEQPYCPANCTMLLSIGYPVFSDPTTKSSILTISATVVPLRQGQGSAQDFQGIRDD